MKDITRKELMDKYGIELPVGRYHIYKKDGEYIIYTVSDDTYGCVLTGLNKVKGKVVDSRICFEKLMDKYLLPAYKSGCKIFWNIKKMYK